jgi:hypothetical protein
MVPRSTGRYEKQRKVLARYVKEERRLETFLPSPL